MKIMVARESHDNIFLDKILETDNTFQKDVMMGLNVVSRANDSIRNVAGDQFVIFFACPPTDWQGIDVFRESFLATMCRSIEEDEGYRNAYE